MKMRSAFTGSLVLALVASAAAEFSYESITNQDYLQYGEVSPSHITLECSNDRLLESNALHCTQQDAVPRFPVIACHGLSHRCSATAVNHPHYQQSMFPTMGIQVPNVCIMQRGSPCNAVLHLQPPLKEVTTTLRAFAGHVLWTSAGPGCAGGLQLFRELRKCNASALGGRRCSHSSPQPRPL